jgi:hypothetical protein
MKELKIYEFQAKHIEDAFRLVSNVYECHKKESSLDRDVMQAYMLVKNEIETQLTKLKNG